MLASLGAALLVLEYWDSWHVCHHSRPCVCFQTAHLFMCFICLVHLSSWELNNLPLDLIYTSIHGLKHFWQCALLVVSTGSKVQKVIMELHLIITKGVLK